MIYSLTYKDGSGGSGNSEVALSDYAVRNINNEIRRVPGVGKVQFFAADVAMRVWVDPNKLLGYGLSVADVNAAIAPRTRRCRPAALAPRPQGPARS